MQQGRAHFLLEKYLDRSITSQELEELNALLSKDAGSLEDALADMIAQSPGMDDYHEEVWDPLYDRIGERMEEAAPEGEASPVVGISRKRRWLLAAAAVVLLLIGAGSLFRYNNKPAAPIALVKDTTYLHDAAPGGNKAVLRLANDSVIDLTGAKNGILDQQSGSQVVKPADGELAYEKGGVGPVGFNTLTTPRGGQYRLTLPDGSRVWLNAASALKYPTVFSGKERVVELQGEAYFEVAQNAAMPFRVMVRKTPVEKPVQVEVLGTQFNVMAYPDEPYISTTLLEGSVRVREGAKAVLLKPGEQARENNVNPVDTEEVVAWKNGMFKFDEATIEQVMRQISRWYDVEVVYVNEHPKDVFRGEMYRNVNASKILRVLQASGVHFTVEGKKIYVKS